MRSLRWLMLWTLVLPLRLLASPAPGEDGHQAQRAAASADANPAIESTPPEFISTFDLYAANRAEGRANFITIDLLLVAYALLREQELAQLESTRLIADFEHFLRRAAAAFAKQTDSATTIANRQFVAVLQALLSGDAAAMASNPSAAAEFALAIESGGISLSPLWGVSLDYGQLKPRSHYDDNGARARYFRARRYAALVWFPLVASSATGVSTSMRTLRVGQAHQWAALLDSDDALSAAYRAITEPLEWLVGAPDDLPTAWLAAGDASSGMDKLADSLVQRALQEQRTPRVISAQVDTSKLETGQTVAEVSIAWRLLPGSAPSLVSALQDLVYDRVGAFNGEGEAPWVTVNVNGKPVKGFPRYLELLALLGSPGAQRSIADDGTTAFSGYARAAQAARARLNGATGQERALLALIKTGLEAPTSDREPSRWLALLTWNAHATLLYSAPSYTPMGKGVGLTSARSLSTLETGTRIYAALTELARAHLSATALPSWSQYAALAARCTEISGRLERGERLGVTDSKFLEDLDLALLQLVGKPEKPIVVDVHSAPGVNRVLQAATGFPKIVIAPEAGLDGPRGARLTYREFLQPMDQRLTDAQWRRDPRLFEEFDNATGQSLTIPAGLTDLSSVGADGSGAKVSDDVDPVDVKLDADLLGRAAANSPAEVVVDITLVDVAAAKNFLADLAAHEIACLSHAANHVYCRVPSSKIRSVARRDAVHSMRVDRAAMGSTTGGQTP